MEKTRQQSDHVVSYAQVLAKSPNVLHNADITVMGRPFPNWAHCSRKTHLEQWPMHFMIVPVGEDSYKTYGCISCAIEDMVEHGFNLTVYVTDGLDPTRLTCIYAAKPEMGTVKIMAYTDINPMDN
jgi:hypothetical protein